MGGEADALDMSPTDADYVVLVDSLEQEWIEQLERLDSGYRRVAQLQFRDPFGWNPRFHFINPAVHILRREDLHSEAEPGLARRGRPESAGPSAEP